MCTNYLPTRVDRLSRHLGLAPLENVSFRDEVYPGHLAPIVRYRNPMDALTGPAEIAAAVFGLIPGWSRDGRNWRHCYNARSETVADKPSFRSAWRRGQACVVYADAIYEPDYQTGRAVRWRIERADGEPLAIAAIWDAWRVRAAAPDQPPLGPPDARALGEEWLLGFALLTLNADGHPVMGRFHAPGDEKRTVAMLDAQEARAWLEVDPAERTALLHAPDASTLITRADPRPPRRAAAPPIPPILPRTEQ